MTWLSAHLRVARGDFQLDVKLDLPAQGITALFGHTGCGKTTCLRALAGLDHLPNSHLHVNGQAWQDTAQGIFLAPHQRPIGYVFQEASLFSHLNVQDNLLFGFKRIAKHQRRIQPDEVIALLNLAPLLKRGVKQLSGGERQRVAIGRALLSSPQLLLMDEPLSALDHKLKAEILPYLARLPQQLNLPIIYVSHSVDEIARLSDRIYLIEKGQLIASGESTHLLQAHYRYFSHFDELSSVFHGTLKAHLAHLHLSVLTCDDVQFRLARRSAHVGEQVRFRIYASDVSVCLSKPVDSSILNIFWGHIEHIDESQQHSEVILRIRLSQNVRIFAKISHYSRQKLGLSLDKGVWVQVKSLAIL